MKAQHRHMNRMKRFLLLLIALNTGLCSAYAAASDTVITMSAGAQRNADLVISAVKTGSLNNTLEAMGTVTAEAGRVVRIHPAGSGKVLDVLVVPGQHVKKGEVLLTYQDHSLHLLHLEIIKAQAALTTAQAAYQNAASAYSRGKKLEGATVTVGETTRRFATLKAAKDDVTARQADVEALNHQLEEDYNSVTETNKQKEPEISQIISPAAAEVQSVAVGAADDISPATMLVTLADMSSVWIVSDILPHDAARVSENGIQTTELPSETGTTFLPSKITSAGDIADPATGLVRVISRIPNPDGHLRPGMFLNTYLPLRKTTTGVIVPENAVQDINGASVVFIPAGADHFSPRAVQVGASGNTQKVIVSGLSDGEKIVTHGAFALKAVMLMSDTGDGE
ncbi:efflux RND transporter periplasmic adaptor subunit [Acetobacter thailandicus]|uniref:efflux RND transporter periplasmic adaptor subunit n=1 Tax=Acetobacter thailandicus TaxID=1502842 RepID=UPI002011265E|nr:efflux RND transporter periplasmic adaptor subunit [Acetobacter thailandicus]